MFFNSVSEIEKIATGNGASIFILPDNVDFNIKRALLVKPEEKTSITIEQIRSATSHFNKKQKSDQYIIIRPADKMTEDAQNAFLKNLEEPNDFTHYILVTSQPSRLLATILSRSAIYSLRSEFDLKSLTTSDERKKLLAKKLISAKPSELVGIAKEISAKKEQVRQYTLDILGTAIEILYKTYLLNEKEVFLKKIPKFLKAYEDINNNANIKLHLVVDLL